MVYVVVVIGLGLSSCRLNIEKYVTPWAPRLPRLPPRPLLSQVPSLCGSVFGIHSELGYVTQLQYPQARDLSIPKTEQTSDRSIYSSSSPPPPAPPLALRGQRRGKEDIRKTLASLLRAYPLSSVVENWGQRLPLQQSPMQCPWHAICKLLPTPTLTRSSA